MKASALALLLILASFASPALAKDAREIGAYGDWTAYTFEEDGKTVCYMASTPKTAKGNYTKRGGVYAMVTHRPGDKARDVFSYLTGYTYAPGARVTVTVDGAATILAGTGETAWTSSDEADRKLVAALRKGSKMVVEGVSARGTETTDTFSLSGSGAAYDAISKACNVSQ